MFKHKIYYCQSGAHLSYSQLQIDCELSLVTKNVSKSNHSDEIVLLVSTSKLFSLFARYIIELRNERMTYKATVIMNLCDLSLCDSINKLFARFIIELRNKRMT